MTETETFRIWRSGDRVRIESGSHSVELPVADAVAMARQVLKELAAPSRTNTTWDDNRKEVLRQLYVVERKGVTEIARLWGTGPSNIHKAIRRLGFAVHRPHVAAVARETITASRQRADNIAIGSPPVLRRA